MKKWVAWQLSALLPVRAGTFKNGVPSSRPAPGITSGPSWVVRPVMPVTTVIKIASSSFSIGAGSFRLLWLSDPASIDMPRAIRLVRRSIKAAMSG